MNPNIIITEPAKNLRALGRNSLAGKWKTATLAVIVYILCLQIPPAIFNAVFGINYGSFYENENMHNIDIDIYNAVYNSIPNYSVLSGIYTLLVTGAFTLGITLFFLAMFRKQSVGLSDIFLGFEKFGKAFGLFLFQGLFIFLWTLLFVIPGIIAAIRYSQAFFILADDPSKSIRQCMDESKAMMKGNKASYFCLTLSFIGWLILAVLPSEIIITTANVIGITGFAQVVIEILAGLFVAPVTAYMFSAQAGFYEILAGHLIKETEPAPMPLDSVPLSGNEHEDV